MPYGRSTYRRRSTGTFRPSARSKYMSKKHGTALVKKKRPARSVATTARRALALAKWNNKIAWGKFQCGLQHFHDGLMPFDSLRPICFNMTTPANGEPVWQYAPSGPTGYEVTQVTTFAHPNLTQLTGPGTTGTGDQQHNAWSDCNDDVLSGQYKLLNQKLEFHFQITSSNAARIRIDFVRPKLRRLLRVYNPANVQQGENHMLPDSLGAFSSIMTANNMINPLYYQTVRKPVFLTIAPGNNLTTTSIQKTLHFTHNKVINPIVTNSIVQSSKISLVNQLWCVISTDMRGGTTSGAPSVTVKRYVTWRDNQGHAA